MSHFTNVIGEIITFLTECTSAAIYGILRCAGAFTQLSPDLGVIVDADVASVASADAGQLSTCVSVMFASLSVCNKSTSFPASAEKKHEHTVEMTDQKCGRKIGVSCPNFALFIFYLLPFLPFLQYQTWNLMILF
jgi:hypothetical protein